MTRVLVPRYVSCHCLHSDPCTVSWLRCLYAAVRLLAVQTARLGLHSQLLPWNQPMCRHPWCNMATDQHLMFIAQKACLAVHARSVMQRVCKIVMVFLCCSKRSTSSCPSPSPSSRTLSCNSPHQSTCTSNGMSLVCCNIRLLLSPAAIHTNEPVLSYNS